MFCVNRPYFIQTHRKKKKNESFEILSSRNWMPHLDTECTFIPKYKNMWLHFFFNMEKLATHVKKTPYKTSTYKFKNTEVTILGVHSTDHGKRFILYCVYIYIYIYFLNFLTGTEVFGDRTASARPVFTTTLISHKHIWNKNLRNLTISCWTVYRPTTCFLDDGSVGYVRDVSAASLTVGTN